MVGAEHPSLILAEQFFKVVMVLTALALLYNDRVKHNSSGGSI